MNAREELLKNAPTVDMILREHRVAINSDDLRDRDAQIYRALDEIEGLRKAVLEEAAKAVCTSCRENRKLIEIEPGCFRHEGARPGPAFFLFCYAAGIHALKHPTGERKKGHAKTE